VSPREKFNVKPSTLKVFINCGPEFAVRHLHPQVVAGGYLLDSAQDTAVLAAHNGITPRKGRQRADGTEASVGEGQATLAAL
jgi:hypothetical protein